MATEREAELVSAAYAAGITSPRELANFMAQVTQESGGLTKLEESFIYSRGLHTVPVESVRNNRAEGETAWREAMHGNPEPLANMMYGGRMGNHEPGDGYKFRGRGYIQLTGHNNYAEAGQALGLDLVNHPELAATRENAIKTSIHFWNTNIHDVAPEDVDRATHIINKKSLGLAERREYFAQWQERLTPEVMAGLARGENVLPIEQEVAHRRHSHASGALRQGASGDAVGVLQSQLASLGYTDQQGRALQSDRSFGPATDAAVRTFQRDHHLNDDGIVGPATQRVINEQAQSQTQRDSQQQPQAPGRLDEPGHPDYAFFQQTRDRVYRLDQQLGRTPDQQSDNLASALTVQARADGLQRIDQIALSTDGNRLWAVQTPPGRNDHLFDLRTNVPTAAVNTSMEQSAAQWPQAMLQFQETQQRAQAQAQAQTHVQTQQQATQGPHIGRQ